MAVFLSGGNRGRVKKLQPPEGAPGAIVTGVNITGCMITRAVVAESTNQQFQHTLGKRIFVYPFGDRMGEMGVAGMAYFDCDSGGNHGIGNAIQWYRDRRLANSGERLSVTLGSQNLEGFLVGFRSDTNKTEEGLMEFYLSFGLIPGD